MGGSGSKRWQIGAVGGGLYLVDLAAREASEQGLVSVTLDKGFPPSDTVVTLAGVANLQLTLSSDLTLNPIGIVALGAISPTVMLGGHDPATRVLTAGSPHFVGAGQLGVTFPVGTTAAREWLIDLRCPGLFIPDGGERCLLWPGQALDLPQVIPTCR